MCIQDGKLVGADPLELSTSNPDAPETDNVRVFGRNVGGRMMPAFKGPSGLDSTLQPMLARNKIAWANPRGNSSVIDNVGMLLTATGTVTSASVATANLHTSMKRVAAQLSTAASTNTTGFRYAAAQWFRGDPNRNFGGFHFICRFGPTTGSGINTTRRGFCGFSSSTTAPTNIDPSTLPHVLGVGCDTLDEHYHIMHRTGNLSVIKINTGITKSAADNSEVYELAMFCAPGSDNVQFEFTRLTTGESFRHTANTNLPSPAALLAPRVYYSVGIASGVIGTAIMSMYIETDY